MRVKLVVLCGALLLLFAATAAYAPPPPWEYRDEARGLTLQIWDLGGATAQWTLKSDDGSVDLMSMARLTGRRSRFSLCDRGPISDYSGPLVNVPGRFVAQGGRNRCSAHVRAGSIRVHFNGRST